MTWDHLAEWTVYAMVPGVTLFAILYGFFRPWYRTLPGAAVFISSTGLALLVDITVIYEIFGDDYPGRNFVRQFVFTWIMLGAYTKLGGLIYIWHRDRKAQP
jgi:hypothetical protein